MNRTSRSLIIVLLGISLFSCGETVDEKFSFFPDKPQPAQPITLRYNPTGTNLESGKTIEALAYQFYDAKMPVVKEVAMNKKGKAWLGSFTPDDSALIIFVNFHSDNEMDNNEEAGYKIILKDSFGRDVPGAHGCLAYAAYSGSYPLKIKRDAKLAFEMVQKEFLLFPQNKERFKFIYWSLLPSIDKENGKAKVKAELDSISALGTISLENKKLLANWYSRVDDPVNAEKYRTEVIQAEPEGEFVQNQRFSTFRSLTKVDDKIKFYQEFQKEFPKNQSLSYLANNILGELGKAKRYDEAEKFLTHEVNHPNSNLYNTLAWDMVENEINLQTAAELAKKGTEIAREEIQAPLSEKPSYLTEKEWRENLKYPLGNILDTYAFALYKTGQVVEAIPLLEEAMEIQHHDNNEINERLAMMLVETGKNDKALQFTESLMKAGKKTPKIEDYFKKSWLAIKGSDQGISEFLTKLSDQGIAKLKADLGKEMTTKLAPAFSLNDLSGNNISLADLKGKTVIIDFWATWCGPCIRSFPAMQKAVDNFKNDETVTFLFINTWERGENIKEKVAQFIKEKKVTFHVLMDTENKVVTDYGVEGIPTKFVVDKDGNIRFTSVGFGGEDQKLVDELSLMIEMVKW